MGCLIPYSESGRLSRTARGEGISITLIALGAGYRPYPPRPGGTSPVGSPHRGSGIGFVSPLASLARKLASNSAFALLSFQSRSPARSGFDGLPLTMPETLTCSGAPSNWLEGVGEVNITKNSSEERLWNPRLLPPDRPSAKGSFGRYPAPI